MAGVRLLEAKARIEAALEWLGQTQERRRCFVIVSDSTTRRFVQFYGSEQRGVTLDLPSVELAQEARATADGFLAADPTRFWRKCEGPSHGAALALRVLREVHQLPEESLLTVTQESTHR